MSLSHSAYNLTQAVSFKVQKYFQAAESATDLILKKNPDIL